MRERDVTVTVNIPSPLTMETERGVQSGRLIEGPLFVCLCPLSIPPTPLPPLSLAAFWESGLGVMKAIPMKEGG